MITKSFEHGVDQFIKDAGFYTEQGVAFKALVIKSAYITEEIQKAAETPWNGGNDDDAEALGEADTAANDKAHIHTQNEKTGPEMHIGGRLEGAGIGAAGGAGLGLLTNYLLGLEHPGTSALVGGGLGAGAGALMSPQILAGLAAAIQSGQGLGQRGINYVKDKRDTNAVQAERGQRASVEGAEGMPRSNEDLLAQIEQQQQQIDRMDKAIGDLGRPSGS